MRDEMLRVLPTVLTAGSAYAGLRAPSKLLLRQLLPDRTAYHALKDETLLRHAARAIGMTATVPSPASETYEEAAKHGGGMEMMS